MFNPKMNLLPENMATVLEREIVRGEILIQEQINRRQNQYSLINVSSIDESIVFK